MRGGETFEAAVQDVMNRTSWLRDYLEDYRFTRTYWGRRSWAKRRWQGSRPWKESSDASSPATVFLTLTQKSSATPAVTATDTSLRGDHRPDTRLERTSQRQKSKKSRLALSSRKDVAFPKARVPKLWCANVQSVIVLVTAPSLVRFARDSTGP